MNYKAQYEAARDRIGRFHPSEFIPCTEEDIKALGDLYSALKLPKSYVDFLCHYFRDEYLDNIGYANGEDINIISVEMTGAKAKPTIHSHPRNF